MSKGDPNSNYNIEVVEPAEEKSVGVHYSDPVDTALAQSVTFLTSVGTVASGGTVDGVLQHSSSIASGATWTDEVAGAGNDLTLKAGQILAEGESLLDCPNPRDRYVRQKTTVGTAVCDVCVVAVSGPKLNVVPDATS